MSKPINMEAQRVQKVINDQVERIQVLSMLNSEFFEEIRRKDENDVKHHFGPQLGALVVRHANLEELFNNVCVLDGVKMTPFDDEFNTDESRQCQIDIRTTTSKLVRSFLIKENRLKLEQWAVKSNDTAEFFDSILDLKKLYESKLSTPDEEVKSIRENQRLIKVRVDKLKEVKNIKQEQYNKYIQDCNNQKEIKAQQINFLNGKCGSEKAKRDDIISKAEQEWAIQDKNLDDIHNSNNAELDNQIKRLTNDLKQALKANGDEEANLRKVYKSAHNEYESNMNEYDNQIRNQKHENKKIQEEYDETYNDLLESKELLEMRKEERRKREELAIFMQKRNDEQKEILEKLSKASEYIQAHWRGLLARKDMEKQRKGNKKKKRKK